jgi:D-arabinan endo alpha-(1,5)-arabinofuranosidase
MMLGYYARAGAAVTVLIAAVTVGLAPAGAAQGAPRGQASRVAVLTGAESLNATEARYRIKGTDLGIMWADERGRILVAFGDTFGAGWAGPGSEVGNPAAVDWRSNTLARSSDRNPADGMVFDGFVTDYPGHAKELLPSLKRDDGEISKIPTGGVNVGGRNYLAYMSVRHFGQPGRWITNYSGIAYSDDGGQTWVNAPSGLRPNIPGVDENFQMVTYARRDGFVYAFGTPNGRFGNAYLARVPEQRLLDKPAYEYWTGKAWQPGSSAIAAPIVAGPVGELSVRYDQTFTSWEMMTMDESRGAITVRLAPQPTGPWGAPIPVATSQQYPSLYGGFLHPDSKGSDIYFTMTQYDRYNVSLMHATLPTSAPAP